MYDTDQKEVESIFFQRRQHFKRQTHLLHKVKKKKGKTFKYPFKILSSLNTKKKNTNDLDESCKQKEKQQQSSDSMDNQIDTKSKNRVKSQINKSCPSTLYKLRRSRYLKKKKSLNQKYFRKQKSKKDKYTGFDLSNKINNQSKFRILTNTVDSIEKQIPKKNTQKKRAKSSKVTRKTNSKKSKTRSRKNKSIRSQKKEKFVKTSKKIKTNLKKGNKKKLNLKKHKLIRAKTYAEKF